MRALYIQDVSDLQIHKRTAPAIGRILDASACPTGTKKFADFQRFSAIPTDCPDIAIAAIVMQHGEPATSVAGSLGAASRSPGASPGSEGITRRLKSPVRLADASGRGWGGTTRRLTSPVRLADASHQLEAPAADLSSPPPGRPDRPGGRPRQAGQPVLLRPGPPTAGGASVRSARVSDPAAAGTVRSPPVRPRPDSARPPGRRVGQVVALPRSRVGKNSGDRTTEAPRHRGITEKSRTVGRSGSRNKLATSSRTEEERDRTWSMREGPRAAP